MTDDLLRLAFVGMHPDRRRQLLETHGGVGGLLREVRDGRVKVPERARRAALVDPATRREELAVTGVEVVVRGQAAFPETPRGPS